MFQLISVGELEKSCVIRIRISDKDLCCSRCKQELDVNPLNPRLSTRDMLLGGVTLMTHVNTVGCRHSKGGKGVRSSCRFTR